jgi:hypothetical protein
MKEAGLLLEPSLVTGVCAPTRSPRSPRNRAPRSPARRAWEISRAWGINRGPAPVASPALRAFRPSCSVLVTRDLSRVTAFLIANPRLETWLTQRKQTAAATSNGEFLQVLASRQDRGSQVSGKQGSQVAGQASLGDQWSLGDQSLLARRSSLATAFLIDRACRLEMAVTSCEQGLATQSNRRWIADYNDRKFDFARSCPASVLSKMRFRRL